MAAIYGSAAALLTLVAERLPETRVFLAASGEMFGDAPASPQREDTPCRPRTPYATAKLAAHQLVGQLRARHELFAVSGILYNHESERRARSVRHPQDHPRSRRDRARPPPDAHARRPVGSAGLVVRG